jgi:hypothetical protein
MKRLAKAHSHLARHRPDALRRDCPRHRLIEEGGDDPAVDDILVPLVRWSGRERGADAIAVRAEAELQADRIARAAAEAVMVGADREERISYSGRGRAGRHGTSSSVREIVLMHLMTRSMRGERSTNRTRDDSGDNRLSRCSPVSRQVRRMRG